MNKDKCFNCNKGTLVYSTVNLTGTRNNEEFTVNVPGLKCGWCGYSTIDNRHSGDFSRAISDAYRRAHGLLSGTEIRMRRSEWLQMSQQDFADYLGVGIASVKRWESGQVQDRAMDELIRLKTDPVAARNNLHALEVQKVPEEFILSTVKFGDQGLDLCFSLGQHFTGISKMKMETLDQASDFCTDQVLVA